ncbi:MAG: transporter ATP-binding protein [Acidimicrobiaceae bacterium]|nr:transporter ATP-binding protein [Acidimicrobiaceae bacterium]
MSNDTQRGAPGAPGPGPGASAAMSGRDGLVSAPAGGVVPALSVDGVSVRLGGRAVLEEVTFEVAPGELTALIGANGAGKTTLLRVVLGMQTHTTGSVRVNGRTGAARGEIGYVPQKVLLDPDLPLRARDLVALGVDGDRLGLPLRTRERRELTEEMLEAVGAGAFAGARVGSLSGGEQQRVLIAHALVNRPRVLLLDEPLANLDLRSEQEVVELLARISREQGLAVLLSAHDINPLLPVTERIVYLEGGRAVSGTIEEVVRSEVLSQLYGRHVDVLRVHDRILVVAGEAREHPLRRKDEEGPDAGVVSLR